MNDILELINEISLRKDIITTNIKNYSDAIDNIKKKIIKSFDIEIVQGNKLNIIDGADRKYNTIHNDGGGDCFFHSIIDSGVEINYNGQILNDVYKDDKNAFIKKLREISIDTIKKDQIINFNYLNQKVWYTDMLLSSYWADDYMISALCKTLHITPVLIESTTNMIYCGNFNIFKYESTSQLVYKFFDKQGIEQTEKRVVKYNDIIKLKQSQDRFIIIYYHTQVHYEAVFTKHNDMYIKYFNGFGEFEQYNKELADHIIKSCGYTTKENAEKYTLNELIKSLEKQH